MLTATLSTVVARGWAPGSNESVEDAIRDDITYVKVQAMKNLAPQTVNTSTGPVHASDALSRASFCGTSDLLLRRGL